MPRSRLIGWSAFAVCLIGYGVLTGFIVASKMELLTFKQALLFGAPAGVIGEIGLWIAAGSLGWNLFKGRKALFDRVFRRRRLA
jgi:uncharacterized membrane protein